MIFLQEQTSTVEPWFVEWADAQHYVKDRAKADAMLFEQWLIRHKYVVPANHIGHDFQWVNMKVDVKEVTSKWFNIQPNKIGWYIKCFEKKHLTHFLFIKTTRDPFVPLVVGDVVTITPICVLPVKPVIKSVNQSNTAGGGFIDLATLQFLNEDDDANTCNASAS
jgi:hypothetical protein